MKYTNVLVCQFTSVCLFDFLKCISRFYESVTNLGNYFVTDYMTYLYFMKVDF